MVLSLPLKNVLFNRSTVTKRYYSSRQLQAILDEKVADEIVNEVLAANGVTV